MTNRTPRVAVEPLELRRLLAATELVRNGGFEGVVSSSDWTRTGAFQADSNFLLPRTGSGHAYVNGGAGNNLTGSIQQTISIPSNLTSLTLSFWTRINTSETTTTQQNDTLSVRVLNADGTATLQTLTTLSNLNASTGYVQRTFALARSLIGQTVRLAFNASTNASLATTFRVDDVSLNGVSPEQNNRVVGYLPTYRYSSTFNKLDWSALTHVNYFAISADTTGAISNGNVTAAALNNVVATAHAAGVTVGITVGPQSFSTLAASATARQTFATNVVNFALQYNLDAIDIDWEPPAGNNVASYGSLINDLHAAASPQKIMITAAVNPWTNEIPVAAVNTKMAWLNVMCYDFSYANHATYAHSISGLTDWTNYGVAKNKLVMGLPFYGRAGTSWSNTTSSTYATMLSNHRSSNGGYPGPEVDAFSGFYANGIETIRQKVQYVADNGYGGAMIWELGQDHFEFADSYSQRSLLPVIKSVLRQDGAFGSVTASPSDNSNAPLNGTQKVSVTVTFNAPASGVLQVSLLAEDPTSPTAWVAVGGAGSFTHTFEVPVSESTSGQQFYEIYTQFRPGASAGPLSTVGHSDLLQLTPFRLNWVTFPAAPSDPTPADGAALAAAPTLLDWADAANASGYDVYVNDIFRGTVTSSQWTPNLAFAESVTHTWRIVSRNANGTTAGPTWSFAWTTPDQVPPSISGGSFDVDARRIVLTLSEPATLLDEAVISVNGNDLGLYTSDVSSNQMVFTLPAGLADGDYTFRLSAGALRDSAGNLLSSEYTLGFFLLAGDINRDRSVGFDDLLIVAQNYGASGKTFSQGNVDYSADGVVGFDDLLLLAQRYGSSLSVAASAKTGKSRVRASTDLLA